MKTKAKFIVGLVGAVAEAVVQLSLGGTVQHYASVIVALATAIGVYLTPNTPQPPAGVTGRYERP